jgi:hypothetical protein
MIMARASRGEAAGQTPLPGGNSMSAWRRWRSYAAWIGVLGMMAKSSRLELAWL